MIVCFQGNNTRAIAALEEGDLGYMTFEKALQCAKDKDLDPSLRSKFVELIKGQSKSPTSESPLNAPPPPTCWHALTHAHTHTLVYMHTTVMYVDGGENRDVLERLCLSFVS